MWCDLSTSAPFSSTCCYALLFLAIYTKVVVTNTFGSVGRQADERKGGFCQSSLGTDLGVWWASAAEFSSSVKVEEPLAGQRLRTWVELDGLLWPGRERELDSRGEDISLGEEQSKIKVPDSPGWRLGVRLTTLFCQKITIAYNQRKNWTDNRYDTCELKNNSIFWSHGIFEAFSRWELVEFWNESYWGIRWMCLL